MSEKELYKYFGCRSAAELKEERKKAEQGLSMYRKSFLILQMIDRETGDVIGWCGYHTWYYTHFRAEIGYLISREEYKRRGLMKEALSAVIAYGFDEMGLKRIEALVGPDNEPSIKLIESEGFKQEGYLKEHYFTNGEFQDSIFYALLQKEYRERLRPADRSL